MRRFTTQNLLAEIELYYRKPNFCAIAGDLRPVLYASSCYVGLIYVADSKSKGKSKLFTHPDTLIANQGIKRDTKLGCLTACEKQEWLARRWQAFVDLMQQQLSDPPYWD